MQDSLAPYHLRCENRPNPLGIETEAPRFSWWLTNDGSDTVQTAYEIEVTGPDGLLWTSGKVESSKSTHVEYAGPAFASSTRYHWRVKTYGRKNKDYGWSDPAWFETGLLDAEEWKAEWIGHPPRFTKRAVPPVYLRRDFSLPAEVKQARLYISSRGIFEAQLNGSRVGEDYFAAGWTDYKIRNQYLTYDITEQLTSGDNTVGIILADGWHNGNLKWANARNWYGDDTSVIAQLKIDLENGDTVTLVTDKSWQAATGPILESDFYNGEKYDARAALGDWSKPAYDASKWLSVRIERSPTGATEAKVIEPVRKQEHLAAKSLTRGPDGEWIYDFGQNLVGWAKLKMAVKKRQNITLRFAEMLNPDGTLYVDNLRSAEGTDRYTAKDEKPFEWEPKFTFHGFRYVGLSGTDIEPDIDAVEAVVLHTDAPMTGEFSCSNDLLNRLQKNIVWGQKGNYLEVPTDCPQRDERLGWTGDAQVFVRTASFNMAVEPFFEKWTQDLRDTQSEAGAYAIYAPNLEETLASPAWSDAGVICPWVIYERYGNKRILHDNYAAMCRWVDFQEKTSDDLIWPGKPFGEWQGFGDWLAIDATEPGEALTPKDQIGTAYFAWCAQLLSQVAQVLGKADDARHYAELSENAKIAFRKKFLTPSGLLKTETQTGYLLALGFDLLEDSHRQVAAEALVRDLESRGWHLSTGFVGTGLLMPVLSKEGLNDIAYKVLLQEGYPGWLYSIRQGATTMWERWNSYTHADGFGPVSMNSFNHYAYGAVGEWMYSVIAGIDTLEPGFKKILIRPQPGGGLTWAKGSLDSPYGTITTHWTLDDGIFWLEVTVPPNTTAVVETPDGKRETVGSGQHTFVAKL